MKTYISTAQARQLEEFARRKGGAILPRLGYRAVVQLPDAVPFETVQSRHPDVRISQAGGILGDFDADVCNGELFVFPGPSPFDRYPNGRPVQLQAYLQAEEPEPVPDVLV